MIKGFSQEDSLKVAEALFYDPLLYMRYVLRMEPTWQQEGVLQDVRAWCLEMKGKPFHEQSQFRGAIRSGHGTGKTRLVAALTHWWHNTRPHSLIPCTAPKASQLADVLWREYAKLNEQALEPFNQTSEILNDSIRHRTSPRTWQMLARTARKENPEALHGFHDENMMIVCEEASGIPEEIFEVGEGALSTPGCIILLTGNPTRVEGTFYRAFHQDKELWRTYHFDREKLDPARYSFIDAEYPERMAKKYGRDSNVYRVRVQGQFPTADPDTLIQLWQVEAAVGRDLVPLDDDPVVLGVDVARFGDDESVLLIRHGPLVKELKKWRQLDTMQVAYRVQMEAKKTKCAAILVDSVGVGGGVADRLRDLGKNAVDVNVAERSAHTEEFYRLRDELYWKMREAFEDGKIAIAEEAARLPGEDDMEFVNQLASIKYRYQDGKLRVETKDERKKRGLGSPDRAEALLMTFAHDMQGLRPEVMRQARQRLMPAWAPDF